MTKRNLNIALVWHSGKPIKEQDNTTDLVARTVVLNCLCSGPQGQDGAPAHTSAAEKYKMYKTLRKVEEQGNIVDLTADEVVMIKRCMEHMPPVTYGQVCEILETDMPKDEAPKEEAV